MPTPELIHCVATTPRTLGTHIVKVERVRDHIGAIVENKHSGMTLCGVLVDEIYPHIPATTLVSKRCQDCLDELIEQKHTTGHGAKDEGVIKSV